MTRWPSEQHDGERPLLGLYYAAWSALVLALALALAAMLTRCGPVPAPLPPEPPPAPQGGAGPVLSDCDRAEERLLELDCRTGDGLPLWQTPDGVRFGEACEVAAADGRDWCPAALATIPDCGAIDAAMRSCR